jgi:hypothetical protein
VSVIFVFQHVYVIDGEQLLVDTLISAMDDPGSDEKDILMIISGDESVLYPISLLMFRNFTIFLVAPDESNIQGSRATRVFRWYQDVLGYWPGLDPEQPTSTLGLMSPPQRSVTSGQYMAPSRPPVLSAVSAMTPKSKDNISLPSSHYPTPPVLSPRDSAPRNFGNNHSAEIPATTKPSAPSKQNEMRPSQVPQPIPKEPVQQIEEDSWGADGGWNTSGGWTMSGNSWDADPVTPAPKPEIKPQKPERESKPEQKPQAIQPPPPKFQSSSGSTQVQASMQPPPKRSQSNSSSAKAPNASKRPQSSAFNAVFDPLIQILRETEDRSMRRAQLGEYLAKCKGLYSSAGVNSFGEYIVLATKLNIVTLLGVGGLQKIELNSKV